MADHGFYRSSGAAWQRMLPPEVRRLENGADAADCAGLLVLDQDGARRLASQGRAPLCRTLLLPQDAWTEPLRAILMRLMRFQFSRSP